jgi:hypothetical protein
LSKERPASGHNDLSVSTAGSAEKGTLVLELIC